MTGLYPDVCVMIKIFFFYSYGTHNITGVYSMDGYINIIGAGNIVIQDSTNR